MESIWGKVIVSGILALLFPTSVSLVLVIPGLMVLSHVLGPVFSIGDADIQVFDIVLLVVATKVAITNKERWRLLWGDRAYRAIVVFMGTLLITTIMAGIRFGEKIFLAEMTAWLRLGTQMTVIPLIALSTRDEKQINYTCQLLNYWGYILAGTIFLNVYLLRIGQHLGEVQVQEDMVRYFGPVGDQVGFILLYFIFKALISQKLLEAVIFCIGIVLTGTRGILTSLTIGFGMLFLQKYFIKNKIRWIFTILAICMALGIAVWFNLGGLRLRLFEQRFLVTGALQRWLPINTALLVFLDNPLFGVGFTGFRHIAPDYGIVEAANEKLGGFTPNIIATTGNQFLQVATDGGLVALVAFVWMIFVISRRLQRVMKYSVNQHTVFAAAYIWLWSLVLGNQTAAWILPGSLISYLLWLLLGLAISINLYTKQIRHILLKSSTIKQIR